MIFRAPIPLIAVLVLASCVSGSPTVGFGGSGYVPVDIGNNSYRVYTQETRNCVEVHRTNFVFPPPSRLQVMLEMEVAAEQVTGCAIKKGTFAGDQTISKGQLDCSMRPDAKEWVAGTCVIRPWR
ncbi:hypothetical protein [Celeribacter litoreus]|uniref:hypothetical protein n=1 Tax=Celeribacter litoreus TaxID=2876714 RepID=UPI001CCD5278|nr:hypothetical protein [Celeribacter litoreus]MCA0042324.1 hypothetical protein [Celeribacter litoreus]